MSKKSKPAKWHIAFHTGPRINITKVDAFNPVMIKHNEEMVMRAKNLDARKVPIMLTVKDHELLRYNLSLICGIKKFPVWEDINVFGEGHHVAVLRHPHWEKETNKAKFKVKKMIEDEINEKIANGEIKEKQA